MRSFNSAFLGNGNVGLTDFTIKLNESALHDINMGYYTRKTITPFTSVGYFEEENKFYHPWSIFEQGKKYGSLKLKEVIPIKDYLELPGFIVDDLIDGISKGMIERDNYERDNAPKHDPLKTLSDQDKELIKKLRESGIEL